MRKSKSNKAIDALEMKRKAQAVLNRHIKNMSHEEEISFYQEAVEKGPFADLWQKLIPNPFEQDRIGYARRERGAAGAYSYGM